MTALNYKHKTKVEPKILIMQRLINEAAEQKLNNQGGRATDGKGRLYKVKDGLPMLKGAVEHAIKATLYGDKRNEGESTGVILTKNVIDSPRATKLNKQIQRLNRKAALGYITTEEHTAKVEPLQEELTALGGKNVNVVDLADAAMKITQMKGMAYNVFASTNNITFGLISNMTQAFGGEDFTVKEARRAYTIMLNSTMKSAGVKNDTSVKVAALMEKFDILFETDDTAYNGGKVQKAGVSRFTPYEMQRRSEFFVQGQLMVASMLNKKVKTLDGVETSLFEAFDTNGEWRTDVYGESKGWDGDIDTEGDLGEFRKYQEYLIELNKNVHGNYDPASFPWAKRFMFGRLGLQFKSWLAESLLRRMGAEEYNNALDRNTKGYYRTAFENPRALLKVALMRKDGFEGMSAVDQANLRKAMVEAVVILSSMALGLMMKHLGDDDEEDKAMTNVLLNQIYRVESDMTFFLSPSSFNRIASNPIAAIKAFLDVETAFDNAAAYILQDEDDGRKAVSGTKVLKSIAKASGLPVASVLLKAETQAGKIMNK